jgi:hypothetical protein
LKLETTPPVKLPADPNIMLSKDQCPKTPADMAEMESIPYKSIVGRLLYISITARPDISPAVSQVGRFCHNPGLAHWEAVIRIVLYLKGTQHLSLKLGGKHNGIKIAAYADADWAGETDTRRSRTGYTIFINDSLVIWCSKLQISVALSTMEAEYISVSATSQEVIWGRTFLRELGFEQEDPNIIFEDNKSCIDISTSYKQHSGAKHIDLRYHFIRDCVLNQKDIELEKKATGDMVADLMTKQLPYPAFSKHRHALGMVQFREVLK